MKPVILIIPSINQKDETYFFPAVYCNTIDSCGGIPVICSYKTSYPSYLSLAHGILLIGGSDISPLCYNEEPEPGLGEISPLRDAFELSLVRAALPMGIPVFGICRGAQVLNCALGGTVIQDISHKEGIVLHQQTAPKNTGTHTITIQKNSFLSSLFYPDALSVNSFHHQAIGQLGEGLEAVAWAKDGVIEAFFHKKYPFVLGVQWHPEHLAKQDAKQQALFSTFVRAALDYAEGLYATTNEFMV